MKILVTGGMGFIGSNFIRYVLENKPEYSIINYDKLTYAGNPENLKDIKENKNYTFIKGDICDFDSVSNAILKHNAYVIINFAAESHVDRSIDNPNIFVQTNVIGTQTLLNAALKTNIKKFIQISTDEVYGDLDFDEPAFTEKNHLKPSSPYSASKTSADLLALSYFKTFGLPVMITRCSNNYGPYQFPEKLIPLMINNIRQKKNLPVYGTGKNVRDWIHVADHCSGIISVLENGKIGEVYNFGGNSELSNIDLIKLLLKKLNGSKELITYVKDRPGHDRRYAMNFSKAKKELNWQPKYNFDDGIEETINWYLNNQEWLDNVISGSYKSYYQKMYGNRG